MQSKRKLKNVMIVKPKMEALIMADEQGFFNEENLDETDKQLFNLTYNAVRKSNNQQWKGISPFYFENEKANKEILDKLDDIKTLLKVLVNNEH